MIVYFVLLPFSPPNHLKSSSLFIKSGVLFPIIFAKNLLFDGCGRSVVVSVVVGRVFGNG